MAIEAERAVRDKLIDELRTFMVGPASANEVIEEKASDRYHLGYLSPSGTEVDPEEDQSETVADKEDDGSDDVVMALANVREQSAMGLTFHVESADVPIVIFAGWGEYEPVLDPANSSDQRWQRRPVVLKPIEVYANGIDRLYQSGRDGIDLSARLRSHDGVTTVTASIVNRRVSLDDADNKIYQVHLSATSADRIPRFVARPPSQYVLDEEHWNNELLYRNTRLFAVGHGCSADWSASEDPGLATGVETRWIPATEIWKASTQVLEDDPILKLESLSNPNRRKNTCADLRRVPAAYSAWIEDREKELESILSSYPQGRLERVREAARRNLASCRLQLRRIQEGISMLEREEGAKAWKAFCLANRAMSLSMRQSRPHAEPRWFVFQLAFILICIPSTLRPEHPDRDVLDLLWFPTGGGKTEAYLGLVAVCLFYRRLSAASPDEGAGTAILTRYTLRLLTVQQFERAARLVCACEIVRTDQPQILGEVEFSIGLFVGDPATPNKMKDAQQQLMGTPSKKDGATTLPLVRCPWCNSELSRTNQSIRNGPAGKRLITACPERSCRFSGRIPAIVVDEEIYDYPPSIVIGTVDKFARMAWVPEMKTIFGRGKVRFAPPMLILQDEIHLIRNTLGTMVGLYETVIDHLCSDGVAVAKIIGSTATIRRADEQCRVLFSRRAHQFPPSGLSASDSFFYFEDRSQPGRLYVGLHAQGRSPKHSLARTVGTLTQCVSRIESSKIRDSYYTLVMYFNSLRELGGGLVLAEDDVPRYIKVMPLDENEKHRELIQIKELTSHLPSEMIPAILDHLKTPIPELAPPDDELESEPIDLLLSTSMISVGVDVDRLGLMIVNGQPKTTAEYIQATSRVGRPRGQAGLVVVLYNWTRPRDRSHYERFRSYHEAFYRYVESTSVTPFSARARDRGLRAVLVSVARMMLDRLAPNDSAGKISLNAVSTQMKEFIRVILQRCAAVEPEELSATEQQLNEIVLEWKQQADKRRERGTNFHWSMWRKRTNPEGFLRSPEKEDEKYGLWRTPQSMRDVDPPAPINLLSSEMLRKFE